MVVSDRAPCRFCRKNTAKRSKYHLGLLNSPPIARQGLETGLDEPFFASGTFSPVLCSRVYGEDDWELGRPLTTTILYMTLDRTAENSLCLPARPASRAADPLVGHRGTRITPCLVLARRRTRLSRH